MDIKFRRLAGTQWLLRWPIFMLLLLVLLIDAILYLLIRLIITLYESISYICLCGRNYKRIKSALHSSESFKTWKYYAQSLDKSEDREQWKYIEQSPFYDYKRVNSTIDSLNECVKSKEWPKLLAILQSIYSKNYVGMIDQDSLYSETYFGTKNLINTFIKKVVQATELLLCSGNEDISDAQKSDFLTQAMKSYGRSALFLSGGGYNALFHLGVVKALVENDCLPNIISGSSAGALMAYLISTKSLEELKVFLSYDNITNVANLLNGANESFWTKLKRIISKGHLFDPTDWSQKIRTAFGDMTFEEAYIKTGRILNIPTTNNHKHGLTLILNYVNAPKVCIWSAVMASSALPFVLPPIELYFKDENGNISPYHAFGKCWWDASIKCDIPLVEVSRLWQVSYSIVSQANPHIAPFFYQARGSPGIPTRSRGSRLRGGFVLSGLESWLRLELSKWLQLLAELDLMPEPFGQDWRYVFIQKFGGDVTITPKFMHFSDIFYLVSDPTPKRLKSYYIRGERGAWPRLLKIHNHLIFEKSLQRCAEALGLNPSEPFELSFNNNNSS